MNKYTLFLFFTLLLAAGLLSSCEKCGNVIISEPTPEDAAWLVYKKNDTIAFLTEVNDTVRYIRTGIFAQTLPGEGFSVEDACVDALDVQVRTVLEDVAETRPVLGTRILSQPENVTVELTMGDNEAWEIQNFQPTYDSLQVGEKWYKSVYELNPDAGSPQQVTQLLYNKEFGFLRVRYGNGKLLQFIRRQ
ncbi:hypothetical protein ACXYMU_06440 [Pontibacter sp. CAU 1760]